MKILHISPSYKPASVYGGPIRSVSLLCEALIHHMEIQMLTTTANGEQELPAQRKEVDGVDVFYFERITKDHTHLSPALLYFLYQQIRKHNQQIKTDTLIIHIHSWWNTVALFSCLMARLFKIPVILSPRGMIGKYTFNNRNQLLKKTIHHAIGHYLLKYCHIHATSRKEARDILAIFQPKQMTVIPNLISFEVSKQYQTAQNRSFRILFLSRIEQKKGLELLFHALEQVSINWSLHIVGCGNIRYILQLQALVRDHPLHQRITWGNAVDDVEKYHVFADHDLLVLPSQNENFGNVVLECLSVGTPVAVSSEVGLADYVLKNKLGWVFKPNSMAIAKTLNLAFRAKEERKQIKIKAPNQIRADFDSHKITRQYQELYTKIQQQ
ncbi:XrtY-associated glycosyltransferase XYAG1 [Pedobacter sp. MC2016-24]|uniref:XrtY-associated glycosyltransferase XYAG1 n=1 Tax=Pedobacter sp. MC2016-24 TaxID=2780090 RepID=UPI00188251D9|nr:glycosyltransferase [Pedobacter sp. MC2016-24]MBE9603070.1 glycosyltransferase [Pedobacter sp. MC2016-24]